MVRRYAGHAVETLDDREIVSRTDDLAGEWPSASAAKRRMLAEVPLAMVYADPARPGEQVAVLRNPRPGDWTLKVMYAGQTRHLDTNRPIAAPCTLRTYVALVKAEPDRKRRDSRLAGTGADLSKSVTIKAIP
jgi:hypothetical protein